MQKISILLLILYPDKFSGKIKMQKGGISDMFRTIDWVEINETFNKLNLKFMNASISLGI